MSKYNEVHTGCTLSEIELAERRKMQTTLILRSIGEELNRPLSVIDNNREYLKMHLDAREGAFSLEKTSVALADINSATLHLNRLIENFMEMAASLHGTMEPRLSQVNLCSVLQDVCADSTEIYKAIGITLTLDCNIAQKAYVVADRTFAERICLNLLSNALHACEDGQHVCFMLQETEGGYAMTVTDDGHGFPQERILTAFMPHRHERTLRNEGFERGGGMGLYLCGEYCRLMGWKISIHPQTVGTQVRIEIPRGEQPFSKNVTFYAAEHERQVQSQLSRMEVLRELRAIQGLEGLTR